MGIVEHGRRNDQRRRPRDDRFHRESDHHNFSDAGSGNRIDAAYGFELADHTYRDATSGRKSAASSAGRKVRNRHRSDGYTAIHRNGYVWMHDVVTNNHLSAGPIFGDIHVERPDQVAFVVNTFCTGPTSTFVPGSGGSGFGGGFGLLILSLTLAGLAWTYRKSRRWALSFAVLMLFAIGGAACSSLPKGPNGATPPGDYTVTITATVNGTTVSTPPVPFVVE